MSDRRSFLQRAFGLGAGLLSAPALAAAATAHSTLEGPSSASAQGIKEGHLHPAGPAFNMPTITTEVGDLPYTLEDGVKVFRLTAHVIRQQVAPNKTIDVWGFNGSAPGPTIQVNQGDRVRVVLKNELPEPTSMHWHGFEDAIGYDGMPGISQEPIQPGQSFTYEFTITQEGTFFYHSHMAMQEMAGMLGAFIMHPRVPYRPHCEKDFVINLQEYWTLPNNTVPNTQNMEFNWLVLNGKAGPAATPLIVRQGDRVRLRFINLGMDHHPMHVHGHTFYVTGTEGGRIPETAWWPGNTVLVGVAQARTVEFVANNAGDWMVHCHLPHHMMNQMNSQAGPMTRDVGRGLPLPKGASEPAGSAATLGAPAGTGTGSLASGKLDPSMMGMSAQMRSAMPGMEGMQMDAGPKAENERAPAMGKEQMRNMMAFDMSAPAMQQQQKEPAQNANDVPNFPQDAYMEGPMMNMDRSVAKPENAGLRPGWSRFMQGMMTFVRVLPPEEYDRVVAGMKDAAREGDPYAVLYTQRVQNGS